MRRKTNTENTEAFITFNKEYQQEISRRYRLCEEVLGILAEAERLLKEIQLKHEHKEQDNNL